MGEKSKAAVHEGVQVLGFEAVGQGAKAGYVSKEDSDVLTFALQGAAGGENFVGEVFGGVGQRRAILSSGALYGWGTAVTLVHTSTRPSSSAATRWA